MIHVTASAVQRLHVLILEHPEDPVVRVKVEDINDTTLSFHMTLEESIQPDDTVQDIEGLTVAIAAGSMSRMAGMTIDYVKAQGFIFIHPDHQQRTELNVFNLN